MLRLSDLAAIWRCRAHKLWVPIAECRFFVGWYAITRFGKGPEILLPPTYKVVSADIAMCQGEFPEAFVPGFPSGLDWGGAATGIRGDAGRNAFLRYFHTGILVPGPITLKLGKTARLAWSFPPHRCAQRNAGSANIAQDPDKNTGRAKPP